MPGNVEKQSILVTGGAGFIGTHTVLQLLKEGFRVSIIDNLDNAANEAVCRVRDIAGCDLSRNLQFYLGDLRDKDFLDNLFSQNSYIGQAFGAVLARYGSVCQRDPTSRWWRDTIFHHRHWIMFTAHPAVAVFNFNPVFDAVIHFAGLKAVGESVEKPFLYYNNNIVGSLLLCQTMAKYGCKKLVSSSSATVYGQPDKVPCVEDDPLHAMNPYGRTKFFFEEMARDIQKADPEWRIILLRYFNPVGAHESGEIGEDPKGIPNNLMPYIQQVAVGRFPQLNIYGYDYPTKDGSAVRDYIHVMDLATGHIASLRKLFTMKNIGCTAYNLGTGCGTSVFEMIAAFEKACGKKIPTKMCQRRPGDATTVYASTDKAQKELGWKAKYGIDEMCRDQWNWAKKNPWGYNPTS